MMYEMGNSTPPRRRFKGRASVVPAFLTLFAIGVAAPSPAHGQYNTYHCKRIDGGAINGTTIGLANNTIVVAPGERLTGHVAVEAHFWIHWDTTVALGGTVTWEPRDEQYWLYLPDIATDGGAQTKNFYVPVNRVAPNEPGTYYIIIAYARDHISRIFSCSSGSDPAPGDDWNDGNDVGIDWTPEQLQGALNDGSLQVLRKTGATYNLEDMAAAAVRVVVCAPDGPDDPDLDGVTGCADVCPFVGQSGSVDGEGRPLGDLDRNCAVDLVDYSIMLLNFTGPPAP